MLISANVTDKLLDIYLRTSVLEGVARVHPGTWSKLPGSRGLDAALAGVGEVGGKWRAPGTRLLSRLRRGITFGGHLSAEDVEDVEALVLEGLSRSEDVEGGQVYDIGRVLGVSALSDEGFKRVGEYLQRHGLHRAIGFLRAMKSVPLDEDMPVAPRDLAEVLRTLGDADDADVFEWARREWERAYHAAPGKFRVLNMWLADPSRTLTSIAVELEFGHNQYSKKADPSFVVRVLKDAFRLLAERVADAPPKVIRKIELANVDRGRVARVVQ